MKQYAAWLMLFTAPRMTACPKIFPVKRRGCTSSIILMPYGIHIDQIDGELCLRMDRIHQKNASVFDIMLEWYEAWNKNQEDESDPYGYPEWKLEYPHPSRKE